MPEDLDSAAQWTKADDVARRIAEAVREETDAQKFKEKAEAVDREGMKVVVQDLPPVTQDGRVADLANRTPPGRPPAKFDASFVKAVFALHAPGDQGTLVRSAFGTHVLMLVEIQEPKQIDAETRRVMLADEIRATRMREKLDVLFTSLLAQTPPKVERNVDAMLGVVSDSMLGEAGQVP
jgi:hypothetical protein